jgi:hypothetical protein
VLRAIGIEDAVDDSANNEGYSFMFDPTPKNQDNQNEPNHG